MAFFNKNAEKKFLHDSYFKDFQADGLNIRLIHETYHKGFTKKCEAGCGSSQMVLPSIDVINNRGLADILLNYTEFDIIRYPTSIELDFDSLEVITLYFNQSN